MPFHLNGKNGFLKSDPMFQQIIRQPLTNPVIFDVIGNNAGHVS